MYKGIIDHIEWERVHLTLSGTLTEIRSEEEKEDLIRLREFAIDVKNMDKYNYNKTRYPEWLKKIIGPSYDFEKPYFFLRTAYYASIYPIDAELDQDGHFSIHFNITNFRDRKEIPNGQFQISVFHRGIDFALVASADVAASVFELSRPHIFNKNTECYVVSFSTTPNEMDPVLNLSSFRFKRKRKRPFDLKRIFRETRDTIIKFMIRRYYAVMYYLVPKRGKRILIATEARGNLQGNLEAIYNGIIRRGLDKKFKILTSFRKAAGGHGSRASWVKVITDVAISDIILIDDFAPFLNWLKLKPKNKLIQVWHAGVGFKSVGFCRFGGKGTPALDLGHRQYTYAITASSVLKSVYSEVFGIEESAVIPTGLPRIDELLQEGSQEAFVKEFYEEYPELENKKIILFAPTFRGSGQRTAHYPYSLLDMKRIYDFCGDEYVFMFKMHPFIDEKPPIPDEYKDRIIDFSAFPNVNDLLRVTDLMITDYSSVIYEYALFRKPMLFFAFDKTEYAAARGFHHDYDSFCPGKVCQTFDEMETAIINRDFEVEKVDQFIRDYFDYLDADSTDRFIDWILLGGLDHTEQGAKNQN